MMEILNHLRDHDLGFQMRMWCPDVILGMGG